MSLIDRLQGKKRVNSFEQAKALGDGAQVEIKIPHKRWRRTKVTGCNDEQVLLAPTDLIRGRMYGPYGNNAITRASFKDMSGAKKVTIRTPRT